MFKKTKKNLQLNFFSSSQQLLSERAMKAYHDNRMQGRLEKDTVIRK
jgi:hypothetical protein